MYNKIYYVKKGRIKMETDDISEKQKRYLSLESILFILNTAPRTGAKKDTPEGARIATLSEMLCK